MSAALIECADSHARGGEYGKAERLYRDVLDIDPSDSRVRNNLGFVLERSGRCELAADEYRHALRQGPGESVVRRNLALVLSHLGRHEEAQPLWVDELTETDDGVRFVDQQIGEEMRADRLDAAAGLAHVFADVRHGAVRHGSNGQGTDDELSWRADRKISVSKLRHDVAQLRFLRQRGRLDESFDSVISKFEATIARLAHVHPEDRLDLDDQARRDLGSYYSRMVYLPKCSAVEQALGTGWSRADVDADYVNSRCGIVVVDDFLSDEALASLQRFANEATVWFANRYAHGRLGAFIRDGFNSPLLLQVAEELRVAMPTVIGDRHPLRQLWGFKNPPSVPADASVHADFAAVNVNLWITPTRYNLDPASGGMIIYDVGAPPNWDFHKYNARHDLIRAHLRASAATPLIVPYRCNRGVVFNSDLFHETQAVHFAEDYSGRRVNITFLYGEREDDVHHPAGQIAGVDRTSSSAWKSQALARRVRSA